MRARLNLMYQRARRFTFSLTIPAFPIFFNGALAYFTWQRRQGFSFAPSKAQIGALRRENSAKEVAFQASLLGIVPLDKSRRVILDVGANLGYSTLKHSSATHLLGCESPVHICVEPNWQNFPYMVKNLAKISNWFLVPLAISSRVGFITGGIPTSYNWRGADGRKNTGLFSTVDGLEIDNGRTLNLPAVTADTIAAFIGDLKVWFCKIDIEGSEQTFLEQANNWLLDGTAIIQFESNPIYQTDQSISSVEELAHSADYEIMVLPSADLAGTHERWLIPRKLAQQAFDKCGLISTTKITSGAQ